MEISLSVIITSTTGHIILVKLLNFLADGHNRTKRRNPLRLIEAEELTEQGITPDELHRARELASLSAVGRVMEEDAYRRLIAG